SAAEAVSAVARLLGIAETRVLDTHLRADAAGFVGRPLSDRDDLRAASRHRGELTLHLDEMLAADGSTEMTEEEEDRRLLAPEVREADDAAVARHERGVWSELPGCDHRSAIARRTANGKRRHDDWPAARRRCGPSPKRRAASGGRRLRASSFLRGLRERRPPPAPCPHRGVGDGPGPAPPPPAAPGGGGRGRAGRTAARRSRGWGFTAAGSPTSSRRAGPRASSV